jgi:hypothetical protein
MTTYKLKGYIMQKINHKLFINFLKDKGITQKAFSNYAKIPYDTVTGWKKKGKVPTYAMVIAKDIAYRMHLDKQTRQQLQRRNKRDRIKVIGLDAAEQKRIESAFWGSNYTAGEIIENARKGDQTTLKQLKENVPKGLFEKTLQAQVKHYA